MSGAAEAFGGAGGTTPEGRSGTPLAAPETVKIQFKAVGAAPILRKNKFKISNQENFSTVVMFLRRQLEVGEGDAVYCYLMSSFAPSPNQKLQDLAECFAVEGELVVQYSLAPAYG